MTRAVERGIEQISRSHVQRILQAGDVRPHRVQQWLHSPDPAFREKVKSGRTLPRVASIGSHSLTDRRQTSAHSNGSFCDARLISLYRRAIKSASANAQVLSASSGGGCMFADLVRGLQCLRFAAHRAVVCSVTRSIPRRSFFESCSLAKIDKNISLFRLFPR